MQGGGSSASAGGGSRETWPPLLLLLLGTDHGLSVGFLGGVERVGFSVIFCLQSLSFLK